jgi:hypothetical protein
MTPQEYEPTNERIRITHESTTESIPVRVTIVRDDDIQIDHESASLASSEGGWAST